MFYNVNLNCTRIDLENNNNNNNSNNNNNNKKKQRNIKHSKSLHANKRIKLNFFPF